MPTPSRTGRPWRRIRDRVIRRDGGICHLCGQPGADTADHIVPYSKGGTNTLDNLAAAHHNVPPYCNRRRGDRDITTTRTRVQPSTTQGWDW